MTTSDTLPVPLAAALDRHEHAWLAESRHTTSEGVVLYVRCIGCGTRRVDVAPHPHLPPRALSRPIGVTSADAIAP
ncbi:hypothetical protein [Microbacterium paraoxydans]|uniref:Uncharacterized protein n=1 Tax=Microbacterium paraoxydans TaxID=199592 RepID=A0ABS5INF0_9MICO|nr:hypothetical protein [Microbacterium paraoxydans]MBS0024385.1 hypothetical protein [Microbacterium paraoxydans]